MSITISPKMTPEEIKKALERLPSGKRLQAKKYSGAIKLREDPLKYQKRIRDEWN
ncbi:MAG: hypothetical protein EPGJADBJ_03054 [Saprospiraceae bacterium]|nr:hypothetical protein [Saprospiraceae bacterium]